MAIKPTIYKFKIALSDMNRAVYDSLNLTIAQHPSESAERMMARVLAFCLNWQEFLTFTKGLSDIDEPAIWAKSLDEQILLWVDVGEPSLDRLKKATRQARKTQIYSFNSKSDVWWEQGQVKFEKLNADYYRIDNNQIKSLAQMVERTMDMSVTISEQSAYFATAQGECEVTWQNLSVAEE